jgi:hypothetical protein
MAPEGGRERGATVQERAEPFMPVAIVPDTGLPSPDPA